MGITALELYFRPPMAIARLGGSNTPLESFVWSEDPTNSGAAKTVIEPAVTLVIEPDGSVRPYLPVVLRFRDGDHFRPVAPFFELWLRFESDDGVFHDEPLTARHSSRSRRVDRVSLVRGDGGEPEGGAALGRPGERVPGHNPGRRQRPSPSPVTRVEFAPAGERAPGLGRPPDPAGRFSGRQADGRTRDGRRPRALFGYGLPQQKAKCMDHRLPHRRRRRTPAACTSSSSLKTAS